MDKRTERINMSPPQSQPNPAQPHPNQPNPTQPRIPKNKEIRFIISSAFSLKPSPIEKYKMKIASLFFIQTICRTSTMRTISVRKTPEKNNATFG
jgi:hypothetical protein